VGIIVDTSILVSGERSGQSAPQVLARLQEAFGETEMGISVITLAELTHGVQRAKTNAQRERHQAFVEDLKAAIVAYPVDAAVAESAGTLAGREANRGITLPIEDLLIGATALQLGFDVVTDNTRHFEKIPGLIVRRL
jgi:predicted nucleic acid-binding protein